MDQILQLGCGIRPIDGAVNHDLIKHANYVDVAWDLNNTPWPWDDGSFHKIYALDVMEHLKIDIQIWLDECWRVLVDDGLLALRLPSWDNPVSYRDPTHERVFHHETFDYWDKSKQLHKDYGHFYFLDSDKWWSIVTVERVNAGDLGFVMQKQGK